MRDKRSRSNNVGVLKSFDELPEEVQKALVWIYGEDAAAEILVPEEVLEARKKLNEKPRVKCILPKLFINTNGEFVVREPSGERIVKGESTHNGRRFYRVGNYQNWAHTKVYELFVGRVPPGYKIVFIDGDTGNAALGNLALIPKEIEESNAWSSAA